MRTNVNIRIFTLLCITSILILAGCKKSQKYLHDDPSDPECIFAKKAIFDDDSILLEHQLKKGVNPNLKFAFGQTLIHYAIREGSIECLKTLIKYNADVNAFCDYGTPLHGATLGNYEHALTMIEILLYSGADVSIRDNEGFYALDNAKANKLNSCITLIEDKMKALGLPAHFNEAEMSVVPEVSIRYARGYGKEVQLLHHDGKYEAYNVEILSVIQFLHPFQNVRYYYGKVDNAPLNITFMGSYTDKHLNWNIITNALKKTFNISITKKKEEKLVKSLKVLPNITLKLNKTRSPCRYSWGEIDRGYYFKNCTMDDLTYVLEKIFDNMSDNNNEYYGLSSIEVVDKTNLAGYYTFQVECNKYDPNDFIDSLKEVGLNLIDTKIFEETLEVRSK